MKICLLDAETLGSDMDLSIFKKFGELEVYQVTSDEEAAHRIADAEVVITNKVNLGEANMKTAGKLKLICITATGTNNVDLKYASERGIAVANVAGYSTQSVSQHTFAMLFYLLEHLQQYDTYTKSGEYAKSDVFDCIDYPFWELDGKTWGIIGLGAIGRSVASIAKAFGCHVVYYSSTGKNDQPGFTRLTLEELLKQSDVVSIHAPLHDGTRNLIDAPQLQLMKKNAILLNVGRGTIVNEAALADALEREVIGGAGLDVLGREPVEADNPLLKIKHSERLIITPHIAWASLEARERLMNETMLNIEAFQKGERRNRVES